MLIDNGTTYAQIVTVPIVLAVFACTFAIIRNLL
jgi:hypothetical protein